MFRSSGLTLWLLMLPILFATASNYAEPNEWGPPEGRMNWNDAMAKCQGQGMRLPTIQELMAAYEAGITKPWDFDLFWSSSEALFPGSARAYRLYTQNGGTSDENKETPAAVRCLR